MTEYRTDADGVMRQRAPRYGVPNGPQMAPTNGTNGRPRGSVSQVAPPTDHRSAAPAPVQLPPALPPGALPPQMNPRELPVIPGQLRVPVDFPFMDGGQNFDPITGRWL